MKSLLQKISLLTFACTFIVFISANAQCNIIANPAAGITLTCSNASPSSTNRSSLAYNPSLQLYYSVNAGDITYPIETFTNAGVRVNSAAAGYDFRGIWWNKITSQLQGNVYSGAGIISLTLDNTSGYALGGGSDISGTNGTPYAQSAAAFDPVNNQIDYYYSGMIYQYDYATQSLVNTEVVGGLPVATTNLSPYTMIYTGCTGKEYGFYDNVNRIIYFTDLTGTYVGESQLPSDAPLVPVVGMAYANNLLWLFNSATLQWQSYNVLNGALPVTLTSISATYSNSKVSIYWSTQNEINTDNYTVQKSTDGTNFKNIAVVAAKSKNANEYSYDDENVSKGTLYYRLKNIDKDGNFTYSKIVSVTVPEKSQLFSVSPNPATSFTKLSFSQPVEQAEISLFTLSGKKIFSQQATFQTQAYILNVQSMQPGIYIISVKNNNTIYRQKLVIMK